LTLKLIYQIKNGAYRTAKECIGT